MKYSIQVSKDTHSLLKKISWRRGVSMVELVTVAVEEFFKEEIKSKGKVN